MRRMKMYKASKVSKKKDKGNRKYCKSYEASTWRLVRTQQDRDLEYQRGSKFQNFLTKDQKQQIMYWLAVIEKHKPATELNLFAAGTPLRMLHAWYNIQTPYRIDRMAVYLMQPISDEMAKEYGGRWLDYRKPANEFAAIYEGQENKQARLDWLRRETPLILDMLQNTKLIAEGGVDYDGVLQDNPPTFLGALLPAQTTSTYEVTSKMFDNVLDGVKKKHELSGNSGQLTQPPEPQILQLGSKPIDAVEAERCFKAWDKIEDSYLSINGGK